MLAHILLLLASSAVSSLASARQLHVPCCSPSQVATLAALSAPQNLTVSGSTLAPFLVPRVSGTPENIQVQNHLISTFRDLGWHVDEDPFEARTPLGFKKFNNIIATHNPSAPSKLVLAAHFDSKYFPDEVFIGATDSAAPCAILVDVAKTLTRYLDAHLDPSTTVQMVFFDGEEAFVYWNDEDSIYGSRHLAEVWAQTYVADRDGGPYARGLGATANAKTVLASIDHLVLLDLLGAKYANKPGGTGTQVIQIKNKQAKTQAQWADLVAAQNLLAAQGLLSASVTAQMKGTADGGHLLEALDSVNGVQDDHVPFQKRGVPIVHVIPVPFPTVWHQLTDNADALDPDIVHDFALIFRLYVARFMGLNIS
ncbi:hypothetical protein HDU87_003358 [Geranomyces variabilis]|uniref:Peptide hydrolase n=1 Tax=Geranomyces variabilis TaxID=109894 RepID=A0AAD5TJZ4_9FUNG|nr:hypothetical protein HDU87_003358 [Geranomyces variabilis]